MCALRGFLLKLTLSVEDFVGSKRLTLSPHRFLNSGRRSTYKFISSFSPQYIPLVMALFATRNGNARSKTMNTYRKYVIIDYCTSCSIAFQAALLTFELPKNLSLASRTAPSASLTLRIILLFALNERL